MSKVPESEPEETTIELDNGRVVNMGDRVAISWLYRNDNLRTRLGITDETVARFMGSHVLTAEENGELLFDGNPIPLIEVELDDGSTEEVWGFECNWAPYDEHVADMQQLGGYIPDYPEV